MRHRDTERQRGGDSEETDDTEEVPPLADRIKTIPEAVQVSLKNGLGKDPLFTFSRALRAFEVTTASKLPKEELARVFSAWWNAAKPLLPNGAEFDEWRFMFQDIFAKTRVALGANPLREAIRRAKANPASPHAERYDSLALKRLVIVCYQLQLLAGDSPFFLSVRAAGKILKMKPNQASAMLKGLVNDGVLAVVKQGMPGGKEATRFRFVTAGSSNNRKSDDSVNTPLTFPDGSERPRVRTH